MIGLSDVGSEGPAGEELLSQYFGGQPHGISTSSVLALNSSGSISQSRSHSAMSTGTFPDYRAFQSSSLGP